MKEFAMTMTKNKPPIEVATWKNLRLQVEEHKSSRRIRLPGVGQFGVYAAVHECDLDACLKIEVPCNLVKANPKFPQSKGLSITIERNVKSYTSERESLTDRITLKSLDNRDEVFTTFVSNILHVFKNLDEGEKVYEKLLQRVTDWQEMLSRPINKSPSQAETVGLLGEVLFLRDFLIPNLGAEESMNCWTGPIAHKKDFIKNDIGVAYEIKTSHKNVESISISSFEQLDSCGYQALYLVHQTMREDVDEGESLVEVIQSTRLALTEDPNSIDNFDTYIIGLGWTLENMAIEYAKTRYSMNNRDFYKANNENFPCYQIRDRKSGTIGHTYKILISACLPHISSFDRIVKELKGL